MSAHHEEHVNPEPTTHSLNMPAPVVSLRRIAGLVALVASALALTGYSNPAQLVQSYLPAFLLWALPRNRANVLGFAPATGRTPEQGPVLETGRSRRYDLRLTVDLDEGLPDGDA